MSEPVYFQGQQLPPLRDGHVWGMKIWMGGRMEVHQYKAERLQSKKAAISDLCVHGVTQVWLDDAAYVVAEWRQIQAAGQTSTKETST